VRRARHRCSACSRLSRDEIRTAARIAPTIANPAPTRKARSTPFVRATEGSCGHPSRLGRSRPGVRRASTHGRTGASRRCATRALHRWRYERLRGRPPARAHATGRASLSSAGGPGRHAEARHLARAVRAPWPCLGTSQRRRTARVRIRHVRARARRHRRHLIRARPLPLAGETAHGRARARVVRQPRAAPATHPSGRSRTRRRRDARPRRRCRRSSPDRLRLTRLRETLIEPFSQFVSDR
jgi:hypothetical protein